LKNKKDDVRDLGTYRRQNKRLFFFSSINIVINLSSEVTYCNKTFYIIYNSPRAIADAEICYNGGEAIAIIYSQMKWIYFFFLKKMKWIILV